MLPAATQQDILFITGPIWSPCDVPYMIVCATYVSVTSANLGRPQPARGLSLATLRVIVFSNPICPGLG